ncbi:MAG: toll/interleukin-1 receptor domain-containing protein [Clostridia bacterium]|nr:toll/interleukin-1 receptor domain-containing protein [Clostridia bacterium]
MEKKKIIVTYVQEDQEMAIRLEKELYQCGTSADLLLPPPIPKDMEQLKEWKKAMEEAVRQARGVLLLVASGAIRTGHVAYELLGVFEVAENRAKRCQVICLLPDGEDSPVKKLEGELPILRSTPDTLGELALHIAKGQDMEAQKRMLYERLPAYEKAGGAGKAAEILCLLAEAVRKEIRDETEPTGRKSLYGELYRIVERMANIYYPALFTEKRDIWEEITSIKGLIDGEEILAKDPWFLSFAVRFIWYQREILSWAGGGKSDDTYADEQLEYLKVLFAVTKNVQLSSEAIEKKEELSEETLFWLGTRGFVIREKDLETARNATEKTGRGVGVMAAILAGAGAALFGGPALIGGSAAVLGGWMLTQIGKKSEKPKVEEPPKPESEEDIRLKKVADFMKQGNEVLDMIGEDEAAEDFLRCLLTSYRRLHAYCEVIGEQRICLECLDRIVELEEKLGAIEGNGKRTSTKAEEGIRTLLGLSRPQTGNFDVFICHKSEDRDIAEEMYDYFRENMLEPFFDQATLQEFGESEYRKAIMQALDHSRHFVVVVSDLKYLSSKWVSLEMETFQHEKAEGRKENSNFLMVVTDSVYAEIMNSNKQCLDIEYRSYEIIRVSEYRNRILRYVRRT